MGKCAESGEKWCGCSKSARSNMLTTEDETGAGVLDAAAELEGAGAAEVEGAGATELGAGALDGAAAEVAGAGAAAELSTLATLERCQEW